MKIYELIQQKKHVTQNLFLLETFNTASESKSKSWQLWPPNTKSRTAATWLWQQRCCQMWAEQKKLTYRCELSITREDTLQEINISHLGKRKIIFKYAIFGGYVSSLEGNLQKDQPTPSHPSKDGERSWHLRCYLLLIASVDKEVSTELKLRLPQWHNDVSPNPHGCRWEKLYLEVQNT